MYQENARQIFKKDFSEIMINIHFVDSMRRDEFASQWSHKRKEVNISFENYNEMKDSWCYECQHYLWKRKKFV